MNDTRIKLTIVMLLALTLLGVLVFALYDIRNKNNETATLLQLIDGEAESEVFAQSVRIIRKNNEVALSALDDLTLSSSKLVFLIEGIESTGRGLGLVTSISSVDEVKEGDANRIKIRVESLGSWASVFTFLRAIESLPHRVIIDDVSLTKESEAWRLSVLFSLYTFE
jgi:Tfp pilus assembly protein PilO